MALSSESFSGFGGMGGAGIDEADAACKGWAMSSGDERMSCTIVLGCKYRACAESGKLPALPDWPDMLDRE